MKSFKKFIDAEKYAMEVSAKELRGISIVHLFRDGKSRNDLKNIKRDFTVMDTKNEWFYGIDYVMLISNYETPFEVHFTSPKSGKHIEGYATKELAENRCKELKNDNYTKDIYQINLTPKQYYENWVKPFTWSKEISNEYRQTLIEQ